MQKRKLVVIALLVLIFGMIGWQILSSKIGGIMAAKGMRQAPVVEISEIIEKESYNKVDSAGRLEAKYSVDIIARVNGWLQRSYFKEGSFVKRGQLLFLIEPDEYSLAMQKAGANVNSTRAQLVYADKQLIRARELVKQDFIAKSAYDNNLAQRDALKAQLAMYSAAYNDAKRNYGYTHIKSPVDGKIGKILITQGNYVTTAGGKIATVVSTNPMYAYFTLKSQDYLKFRKDNTSSPDLSNMKVQIQLADSSIYEEVGKVEFIDNTIDPSVGTIGLRATFNNPKNLLIPNDYINVVATSVVPEKVLLVPQIAVQDSPEGYYVWMLDENQKTIKRNIEITTQTEGSWVVTKGLKAGDKVISKGFLKIKPGISVQIATPQSQLNAEKKE